MVLLSQDQYNSLVNNRNTEPAEGNALASLKRDVIDSLKDNKNQSSNDDRQLRFYKDALHRLLAVQRKNVPGIAEDDSVASNSHEGERHETQNKTALLNEKAQELEAEAVVRPEEKANEQDAEEVFHDAAEESFSINENASGEKNVVIKRYFDNLLKHCNNYKAIFGEDTENGELVLNGKNVKGSNARDLLSDFSNPWRSKSDPPSGYEQFLAALKDTQCPLSLIGNKARQYPQQPLRRSARTFSVQKW